MYASYHLWPIKVVLQQVWWAYAAMGFASLLCLGRFFLLLREHPRFGLPAAYVLHVWVDAAFALLALFKAPGVGGARWVRTTVMSKSSQYHDRQIGLWEQTLCPQSVNLGRNQPFWGRNLPNVDQH